MSLESFNYIDSLNASNPTTTDNVSEGDDHIRGIKTTIKNTFPNINAAVTATDEELNYVDGVTSNIQTQLGTKLPLAGGTMTGNITLGTNTIDGLEINTTATNNLGLGTGAVDSITTGGYNIGIGDYALSSVDAGSNNTAIGYVTLNTTTSGNGNTSAGFYSLVVNTAGSYNVASGFKALQANTTASGNTGIGYFALAGNTTGINNVALGYQAGTTNTTGSSNIIIGDTVNAPSATASNQTVIGSNQIQCDASTTAGDTRFFLYDVDNATMERVTVGSADSGGTGYKVLRIPN